MQLKEGQDLGPGLLQETVRESRGAHDESVCVPHGEVKQ